MRTPRLKTVLMALTFLFIGVAIGLAGTLLIVGNKARDVAAKQLLSSQPSANEQAGLRFLLRLVARELSLDARQRQALDGSIERHREEIADFKSQMRQGFRQLALSIANELEPTLDSGQRSRLKTYFE